MNVGSPDNLSNISPDEQRELAEFEQWFHEAAPEEQRAAAIGIAAAQLVFKGERTELQRQMETIAGTEPDSGLLNARGFERDMKLLLAETRKEGEVVAVAFFDFDYFKVINDSLGHDVGNIVLHNIVPGVLRKNTRQNDSSTVHKAHKHKDVLAHIPHPTASEASTEEKGRPAARLGGDEYAAGLVLNENAVDDKGRIIPLEEQLAVIIERIRKNLHEQVYSIEGMQDLSDNTGLEFNVSVGTAIAKPGDDYKDLLRQSDISMFENKRERRGTEERDRYES